MRKSRSSVLRSCGAGWLGDVPSNWSVLSGRRVFEARREAARESDEQLSATQRYGVVPQREFMEREDQKVMLALSGMGNFKHVEQDDFVISLRSFEGGIEHSAFTGCVSPAYTVLRLRSEGEPGYFKYLLKSKPYVAALQVTTDSLRDGKSIKYEQFASISIPLPPLPEQAAISAFLDRETGKLDELVGKQKRLIKLLKEKRQALISRAVTKGLDPNVRMKPTGLEWLEDVPEHWQVTRLKFVAVVQTGTAKGKDLAGQTTIMVPYLRVANVQDGYIDLSDVAEIEVPVGDLDRYLLRPGDVLMNEGGDFDKLGRGGIWDGSIDPCIHQNHVFSVRPHGVLPEWLNMVTSSAYGRFYFMSRSKQSTNLASISSTNLMELPMALPPTDEQASIMILLSEQLAQIRALEEQCERSVSLLLERRSSLISAAVTGKIDLRDLATQEQAA